MTIYVLLIENSGLNQAESLLPCLQDQGYHVSVVHTPETAAEKVQTLWPNLIVFNDTNSHLSLTPFQEGIDKIINVPYVIVGDKNHLAAASTDAILVAPGKLQQLTLGVKKAAAHQKNRFIRLPNLILDCKRHQVLSNFQAYTLTPKEFKLLQLLIDHHDEILSRKTIMQQVWETDYMGDTRTLDVHIRWLREKIEDDPSHPRRVITIRGVGYRFVVNPE